MSYQKYQAKQRKIIKAEQFLPPQQIPRGVMNVYEGANDPGIYSGEVVTAQGERVFVQPGEWIVKEPEAHPDRYYPIADEIFQELYDPLDEEMNTQMRNDRIDLIGDLYEKSKDILSRISRGWPHEHHGKEPVIYPQALFTYIEQLRDLAASTDYLPEKIDDGH